MAVTVWRWWLDRLVLRLAAGGCTIFAVFSCFAFYVAMQDQSLAMQDIARGEACGQVVTMAVVLRYEQLAGVVNFIRAGSQSEGIAYALYGGDGRTFAVSPASSAMDSEAVRHLPVSAGGCDKPVGELTKYLSQELGLALPIFRERVVFIRGVPHVLERMGGSGPMEPQIDVLVRVEKGSSDSLWVILGLSTLALGALLAAAFRADGRFGRRIKELNRVFDAVRRGDVSARPEPDLNRDEIARLGANVSDALARNEGMVRQFHLVTQVVAHELARPLTKVMLGVWTAKEFTQEAGTRDSLSQVDTQVKELRRSMLALLDIGRGSGLGEALGDRFDAVDLGAILGEVLDHECAKAEKKGLVLQGAIQPGLQAFASPTMIRIVFENLIDNAIKYTQAGRIDIALSATLGRFTFRVRDTGPGIGPGKAERLLTPFYRDPAAVSVEGYGLGFTIVSNICTQYDFELRLRDTAPGCEVTVEGALAGDADPARPPADGWRHAVAMRVQFVWVRMRRLASVLVAAALCGTPALAAERDLPSRMDTAVLAEYLADYGRAAHDPVAMAAAARMLSAAGVRASASDDPASIEAIAAEATAMMRGEPAGPMQRLFGRLIPHESRGVDGESITTSTFVLPPGGKRSFTLLCRGGEPMMASLSMAAGSDGTLADVGLSVLSGGQEVSVSVGWRSLSAYWMPPRRDRYVVEISNLTAGKTISVRYNVNVL